MADMLEELTGAEEVLWDLSDLYTGADDPAIEQDFTKVDQLATKFAARYRGKVATLIPVELAQALLDLEAVAVELGRLGNYAALQWTTDTANPAFGAMLQRVQEFESQIVQKTLFFDLEWAAIANDQVKI